VKHFTNLPIAAKIMSGLALFAVLAVFITAFGTVQLHSISADTDRLVRGDARSLQLAAEANERKTRQHQIWFQVAIENDKPDFDALMEEIRDERSGIDAQLAELGPLLNGESAERLETAKRALAEYTAATDRIPALWAQGRREDAEDVLQHDARPPFETLNEELSAIVENQEADLDAGAAAAAEHATSATWALILTSLIGLVLIASVVLWLVRRQITKPLGEMTRLMDRLAGGDHNLDVKGGERRDEIGAMARAVTVFRDNARAQASAQAEKERADAEQKLVVETLSGSLAKVSEGDLTADINIDFSPTYVEVKTNFNNALASLRELIGSVMESTSAIRTGSGEIAQASEDLARRTEANAASLEETTAAVSQMNERLRATASAATSTVERADGAIATVSGGRAIADEAVQAMGRVSESAKGIDSVIEGLDKIAFQTRVLAMNAAVEAGRAGEAGRGFAVVADLVSALAMRAEEEAGRARDQLTATQTDIVAAVDMVQKVDGALANISGDVSEVHALLNEMAADNQAQSTAISEISTAITTMDQSTQQNAAMVEETSAAARNLSSEVTTLADQAARFRVDASSKTAGNVRAAAVQQAKTSPKRAAAYSSPVQALPMAAMSNGHAQDDWATF